MEVVVRLIGVIWVTSWEIDKLRDIMAFVKGFGVIQAVLITGIEIGRNNMSEDMWAEIKPMVQ